MNKIHQFFFGGLKIHLLVQLAQYLKINVKKLKNYIIFIFSVKFNN